MWITADGFLGASDTDREYAGGELHALVLSWLEGFGARVINRPAGLGLSGPWRTTDQWRALAREAGLEIRASPGTVRSVGRAGAGTGHRRRDHRGRRRPAPVCEGTLRLVAEQGHDLIELRFDEEWRFADATLTPAVGYGGERRVDAVARALRARAT